MKKNTKDAFEKTDCKTNDLFDDFFSGLYEINFGFQIIFLFLRCLKE